MMMKNKSALITILLWLPLLLLFVQCKDNSVKMPQRGICAHRGANETKPENTISAFKEAIRLGAHMTGDHAR